MAPSSSSDGSTGSISSKIERRTYLRGMAVAAVATGAGAFSTGAVADEHVIEDFERDDPLADYEGLVEWFDTTSDAYEGDQALLLDYDTEDEDSPAGASVFRTDGVNIERGDEVEVYFNNAAVDNFIAVHWMTQEDSVVEGEFDNPDGYTVGISAADGCLKLWVNEDGGLDEQDCVDLPAFLQADGWYRMEFTSDDSTVTFDLYDDDGGDHLVTAEAEDDTWSSGGIGFRGLGNGEKFDYAVYSDGEEETPTPTEEPDDDPTDTPDDDPTDTPDDDDGETEDEGVPGFGVLAALAGLGAAGAAAARRIRSDDE